MPSVARAIVRFSLDGDYGSRATNKARKVLEDAGFDKIGTASYEVDGPSQEDIIAALDATLQILRSLPGGATLDHLWVYLDEPLPAN